MSAAITPGRGETPICKAEAIPTGIYEVQCHASTIADTPEGLVLAFFGGAYGGTEDQGIWFARHIDGRWEPAQRVARPELSRTLCWNPVLHATPDGALLLFYKEGPFPAGWWGLRTRSDDVGVTWQTPTRLPDDIWGPIRNKAVPVSGRGLLCGSSTEHDGWFVHFERTFDEGETWTRTPRVAEDEEFGAIQPTILTWPSGRWQALCRSRAGCVVETFTENEGKTWTSLRATPIPNSNSALDGLVLADGRGLIVYSPTQPGENVHANRNILAVAMSADGSAWERVLTIEEDEDGEYSYPAVIQTTDGLVHVTYTTGVGWTGMKHVVIDAKAFPVPARV